jgi:hypothetical protein
MVSLPWSSTRVNLHVLACMIDTYHGVSGYKKNQTKEQDWQR